MRNCVLYFIVLTGLCIFGLSSTSGAITNSVQLRALTLNTNPIPKSIFNMPTNQAEARDPFFPNSERFHTSGSQAMPVPPPSVVLNLQGISGSAEKRLAIINGRTLAEGEETDLTTSSGHLRIRCLEIKSESVIIEINGTRRELKLRSGI